MIFKGSVDGVKPIQMSFDSTSHLMGYYISEAFGLKYLCLKGDFIMPKRGINIHKRKDGRWEARYQKGRKPDGELIYGSVYGTSYKEAKEKLLLASTRIEKEPVSKVVRT